MWSSQNGKWSIGGFSKIWLQAKHESKKLQHPSIFLANLLEPCYTNMMILFTFWSNSGYWKNLKNHLILSTFWFFNIAFLLYHIQSKKAATNCIGGKGLDGNWACFDFSSSNFNLMGLETEHVLTFLHPILTWWAWKLSMFWLFFIQFLTWWAGN